MAIKIVYWSGTGNTEAMAQHIAQGSEGELFSVSDISPQAALEADVLVLGCPSMGAEELEDGEFEPFMQQIEGGLTGKKVALFGSYDWGDGEWMHIWEDRVKTAGATLVAQGLIVNNTPEGDDIESCKNFGAALK